MAGEKTPQYGDYRVVRKIGKGGFGSVYLAENPLFPKHLFAVKVFDPREDDLDGATPLRDELHNLIGLSHSNIVQVRGFGIELGGERAEPYIVMDYIEGPNGGSYNLKQHLIASGGRLAPLEVKRLFRQILSALALVHKKRIAHLDLKPENILLDRDLNAYVSDFGVSQTVTSHSLRADRPPSIQGFSPIYASPEQIRHAYGSRHSDVFSLGVMILECLTGIRPEVVHSESNPKVDYTPPSASGLDRKWDQLMERCLSIDPAYRFPNAEIFLRALEQMPSNLPGERSDMAVIREAPTPAAGVQVETPRSGVSAGSSTTPRPVIPRIPPATQATITPYEGNISRLLDRERAFERETREEVRRAALNAGALLSARFGIRLIAFFGALIGLLVGAFLGLNIGERVGTQYAGQIGRVLSYFVNDDLGAWIGRGAGQVMGAIAGGLVLAGLGWLLGRLAGTGLYRLTRGAEEE